MKIAIWAAVSTVSQATPDKVSIPIQLEKGRAFISARNHQPAGEYIVPGESRTKYISLYHAEKEIEPLHQMLEAASRKEFDLLFIYDLNRFRTLMRQVYDVLCDYNIQLYIHTNPREPVAPNAYTEEHKAAVGMIVDLANIISRNEINNLQRHFQEKMPGRIHQGLDARLGKIPYGYKRSHPGDKTHPLEIDPAKAAIVKQMAEWYIAGASLKEICRRLNAQNIRSSEGSLWYPESVRIILASPFYAGIVYFGVTRYKRDRRTGTTTRTLNPNPTYGKGKHQPLWDENTHHKLLELIEKRGRGYKGDKTARLSRLLYCFCGKKLYLDRSKKNGSGDNFPYWSCASRLPEHTQLSEKKALTLIIPAIVAEIRNTPNIPEPKIPHDQTEDLTAQLHAIQHKKQRWLDLYETETLDAPTLAARLQSVENELSFINAKLKKAQHTRARTQTRQAAHARLAQLIDHLEGYYLNAPEPQVNADLHEIIEKIVIQRNLLFKIHWWGED